MRPLPARSLRRPRGYTMVELMVAIGIFGLISAAVMPFYIFNLRSIYHGEQKLLINGDIRALTNSMTDNAREANYVVIYRSFRAQNTTDGVAVSRDNNGDGFITALDRRAAGLAGDFVVLVYTRDNGIHHSSFYDGVPNNEPASLVQITRLVGYWVASNRVQPTNPDGTARHALYMFDTDDARTSATATSWTTPWGATFPVSLSTTVTVESLLPPATADAATDARYADILINDLQGRAADGSNFVNYANKSVGVQTRVLHGSRAKRVTNTYNFAITPRG